MNIVYDSDDDGEKLAKSAYRFEKSMKSSSSNNIIYDDADDDELEKQVERAYRFENDTQSVTKSMSQADALELVEALNDDDADDRVPSLEHLDCLKTKFKHTTFRANQWEIIRTVMVEKRDVFAVMATGYGKSLCFQVMHFVIFYSFVVAIILNVDVNSFQLCTKMPWS